MNESILKRIKLKNSNKARGAMLFAFSFVISFFYFPAFAIAAEAIEADVVGTSKEQKAWLALVDQKRWIHGSAVCEENTDPKVDTLKVNESTYIFRQNKCVHYEAPFIFLMLGNEKAFVQDTGASEVESAFPIYKAIKKVVDEYERKHQLAPLKWIVTHSHTHSDHVAGDNQFAGKDQVTLIEPNSKAVEKFFGFNTVNTNTSKNSASTYKEVTLNLGQRELTVFSIPGHQSESIAVYDSHTQWLLTGDSFYPGRLYIKDWNTYTQSINKIIKFSHRKTISGYLGTHIEMSNESGKDYAMGSTFQPNETSLVLSQADLIKLKNTLDAIGEKSKRAVLDKVIIYPVK